MAAQQVARPKRAANASRVTEEIQGPLAGSPTGRPVRSPSPKKVGAPAVAVPKVGAPAVAVPKAKVQRNAVGPARQSTRNGSTAAPARSGSAPRGSANGSQNTQRRQQREASASPTRPPGNCTHPAEGEVKAREANVTFRSKAETRTRTGSAEKSWSHEATGFTEKVEPKSTDGETQTEDPWAYVHIAEKEAKQSHVAPQPKSSPTTGHAPMIDLGQLNSYTLHSLQSLQNLQNFQSLGALQMGAVSSLHALLEVESGIDGREPGECTSSGTARSIARSTSMSANESRWDSLDPSTWPILNSPKSPLPMPSPVNGSNLDFSSMDTISTSDGTDDVLSQSAPADLHLFSDVAGDRRRTNRSPQRRKVSTVPEEADETSEVENDDTLKQRAVEEARAETAFEREKLRQMCDEVNGMLLKLGLERPPEQSPEGTAEGVDGIFRTAMHGLEDLQAALHEKQCFASKSSAEASTHKEREAADKGVQKVSPPTIKSVSLPSEKSRNLVAAEPSSCTNKEFVSCTPPVRRGCSVTAHCACPNPSPPMVSEGIPLRSNSRTWPTPPPKAVVVAPAVAKTVPTPGHPDGPLAACTSAPTLMRLVSAPTSAPNAWIPVPVAKPVSGAAEPCRLVSSPAPAITSAPEVTGLPPALPSRTPFVATPPTAAIQGKLSRNLSTSGLDAGLHNVRGEDVVVSINEAPLAAIGQNELGVYDAWQDGLRTHSNNMATSPQSLQSRAMPTRVYISSKGSIGSPQVEHRTVTIRPPPQPVGPPGTPNVPPSPSLTTKAFNVDSPLPPRPSRARSPSADGPKVLDSQPTTAVIARGAASGPSGSSVTVSAPVARVVRSPKQGHRAVLPVRTAERSGSLPRTCSVTRRLFRPCWVLEREETVVGYLPVDPHNSLNAGST